MIAAIVQRLTGAPFRQVGGAADLPDSEDALVAAPAIFVLPASDAPGKNQVATGVMQNVTATYTLLLAVTRAGATGAAALDPLKTYKDEVIAKLLGWTPDNQIWSPLEIGPGRMFKVGKSTLWWSMTFSTDYLLQKD